MFLRCLLPLRLLFFSVLGWFVFNTSHLTAPVAGFGPYGFSYCGEARASDNAKMQEYTHGNASGAVELSGRRLQYRRQ